MLCFGGPFGDATLLSRPNNFASPSLMTSNWTLCTKAVRTSDLHGGHERGCAAQDAASDQLSSCRESDLSSRRLGEHASTSCNSSTQGQPRAPNQLPPPGKPAARVMLWENPQAISAPSPICPCGPRVGRVCATGYAEVRGRLISRSASWCGWPLAFHVALRPKRGVGGCC